jgi:hypothetical protein
MKAPPARCSSSFDRFTASGRPARGSGDVCEHLFVTSQGHLAAQYARACANGNYLVASGLAAQMKPLALGEALLLLPLIADNDPRRFDVAAVRWHARWQLERSSADLATSGLVLAALGALRGSRRQEALKLLSGLLQ